MKDGVDNAGCSGVVVVVDVVVGGVVVGLVVLAGVVVAGVVVDDDGRGVVNLSV